MDLCVSFQVLPDLPHPGVARHRHPHAVEHVHHSQGGENGTGNAVHIKVQAKSVKVIYVEDKKFGTEISINV